MFECLVASKVQLLFDLVGWYFPESVFILRISISPINAGDVIPFNETSHAGSLCSQGEKPGGEAIYRRGTGAIDLSDHGADGANLKQDRITPSKWQRL
ncbi:hypothetical protein EB810_05450 [Altererythrobacter sp. FM1]|uniref:Uncharacterized protein n=1 Tax=Tsuneonella flava TaxID=2055955 RepID=A0ABX7KBZ4_9SPHN|nr:hypothetical protein [Tsuneonella flava]QSB45786.1 hypothetical protein IDJ81_06775 [Tsuneonella flava]ROT97326.1 hypothetical protein EB810_05450 [Altererythrobacter sp. FM1]